MTTRFDDDPDGTGPAPDDPLAVILRPSSAYLAPPPGHYEAIRRKASRRRLLRTAAGLGATCAVAALIAVPLYFTRPDGPASPTPPLAPPPATTRTTPSEPSPTPTPSESSRPSEPSTRSPSPTPTEPRETVRPSAARSEGTGGSSRTPSGTAATAEPSSAPSGTPTSVPTPTRP
ncbi:hypothetical protein ACQEV2_22020 [Streptomyces sp. CA-251387]|uniref:hypothetical protein n=1 Tax=Streptomyces sp. CA-251387 TaxID=3240064 RepID=UPI003D91BC9A